MDMEEIEKDILGSVSEFLSLGNNFDDEEIDDLVETKFKEMTKLKYIPREKLDLKFGDRVPCIVDNCWYTEYNCLLRIPDFKGIYRRNITGFEICDVCVYQYWHGDLHTDEKYEGLLSNLKAKAEGMIMDHMNGEDSEEEGGK